MSSCPKHKLLVILKEIYKQAERLSLRDTCFYNGCIHLNDGAQVWSTQAA